MKQKEKIIYLAGIIDGEGCVKPNYLIKNKNLVARCVVSNTSFELVSWLKNNFGGYIRIVKREGNRKIQYWWTLRNKEIKDLFPKIIPYLIIKKKEAIQSLSLIKICRKVTKYPY